MCFKAIESTSLESIFLLIIYFTGEKKCEKKQISKNNSITVINIQIIIKSLSKMYPVILNISGTSCVAWMQRVEFTLKAYDRYISVSLFTW